MIQTLLSEGLNSTYTDTIYLYAFVLFLFFTNHERLDLEFFDYFLDSQINSLVFQIIETVKIVYSCFTKVKLRSENRSEF